MLICFFVMSCLYSAVSLTLVREQRFIRTIYYYYVFDLQGTKVTAINLSSVSLQNPFPLEAAVASTWDQLSCSASTVQNAKRKQGLQQTLLFAQLMSPIPKHKHSGNQLPFRFLFSFFYLYTKLQDTRLDMVLHP